LFITKEASLATFCSNLLTVMLSWGKNFMGLTDLFLDIMPGYSKFRAVTIILVIAELVCSAFGCILFAKIYHG
jgi:hypothetical protein